MNIMTIKVFAKANEAALYAKQQVSIPGRRVAVSDKVDTIEIEYPDADGDPAGEELPAAGGRWVVVVF